MRRSTAFLVYDWKPPIDEEMRASALKCRFRTFEDELVLTREANYVHRVRLSAYGPLRPLA